ncbi:zinc-binding alcohol dehydrogenase family protein [Conexibacter stalactiti]|uniref:Zinc-binding alcohol dehydrogenase family protein n=1 Tax=Conexibacter stalactiti TaxID=1940611 RepID=A0ABU4HIB8_9ACTN|nr:zinc-binding alcohol dehydrogenase family protein [Conexibacter stalactiti]MDW5593056.1 zinc-binding alcohol dehydrogenase family protein [Conexibacter stalactiti]MEC5033697.1 zinc-binding alcohol dehydrogenase family protein [Conexibacter stalactiti]
MQAWELRMSTGGLSLADVQEPAARDGAVVLRSEAALVVSYLREYVRGGLPGYLPPAEPFTLGTSGIGVVERVGSGVYGIYPGQRVLATGHAVVAENVPEPAQALLSMTARPEAQPLLDDWRTGTMAQLAAVPASTVTPVPDELAGLSSASLSPLLRCLVPYGGLRRARMAAGETVIVNGATGDFGGAAVQVARALGAARVVAAGRNRARLDALAAFPRVRTVRLNGDVHADAEALRAACGGGADCAIDMIGGATDSAATAAVLAALHDSGRLVFMGSSSALLPVDLTQLMLSNREIVGQFMYARSAPAELLRLTAAGLLDLAAFEVREFPLSELPAAMDAAADATGAVVTINPGR